MTNHEHKQMMGAIHTYILRIAYEYLGKASLSSDKFLEVYELYAMLHLVTTEHPMYKGMTPKQLFKIIRGMYFTRYAITNHSDYLPKRNNTVSKSKVNRLCTNCKYFTIFAGLQPDGSPWIKVDCSIGIINSFENVNPQQVCCTTHEYKR